MQIKITKTADTLSPDLRRVYRAARNKAALHQAIGLGLVSLAKRAFNDPGKRPAPWPAKADGSAATLRKSGTLAKSIRLVSASAVGLRIGTDRHYAAIHQLGGTTAPHVIRPKKGKALAWPGAAHPVAKVNHPGSKIPARPFLPFYKRGRPTKDAVRVTESVVKAKLNWPKK